VFEMTRLLGPRRRAAGAGARHGTAGTRGQSDRGGKRISACA
jgi:hypothetical protein